jgi:hypothetical protein
MPKSKPQLQPQVEPGKPASIPPTPFTEHPPKIEEDLRPRCPRCKGESVRTSDYGGRQYRKCKAPICRWKFSVPKPS